MDFRKNEQKRMLHVVDYIIVLAVILWIVVCVASLTYHVIDAKRYIHRLAYEAARESIEKDRLYHSWAAGHGGIYVPVTDTTRPNPYLSNVKERDIITPSGRRLTLMHPASLMREVHALERDFMDIQGHYTSLQPLQPENAPDAWETKSLIAIKNGKKEIGEIAMLDGALHYRLMFPLFVQEPCLKCHAAQGYKLGDLRGGISASVPMKVFDTVFREHTVAEVKNFAVVGFLGIAGILLVRPYIRKRISEREDALIRIEESDQRTRSIVDNAPFGAHSYRLEKDGRLIFIGANASADRILGIDNSRFVGTTIEEAFPPLAGTDIPDTYRRVAATGKPAELDQVDYDGKDIRGVFEVHAFQTASNHMAVFFSDVTERKKADVALRHSEERFRTIVDTSLEGIITIDDHAVITFTNARMLEILGYSREEILGRSIYDFIHEDERPDHEKQLELRRQGNATVYDRRFRRRDGTVVWTRASASPLFDEQKVYCGAFGLYTDITERKRAEEALRDSEEQLRIIFDASQAGIILVDPQGKIQYANQRMAEMFRCPLPELIGSAYPDHLHPSEKTTGDERMRLLIMGQTQSVSNERHYIRKDGSDFWGYISGRRMEHPDGSLRALVGIIADVTERKQAEETLRDKTQRLQLATESAKLGIWDWDITNNTMIWDDRMFELYGVTRQSFSDNIATWESGLHPDDRSRAIEECASALRGERDFITEFRIQRPDGAVKHIKADALIMRDADGKAVRMIGMNQDITERKQAEEALHESENRYRTLFTRAGDGIFILSGDGTLVEVNESFAGMHGYSAEEMLHMNVKDLDTPESAQRAPERMRRILDGEALTFEVEQYHKDGHVFPLEVSASRISLGGKYFIQCFHRDITERKQVEEALRRSEEQFRLLLNSTGEAIYGIDKAGSCTFCNPACVRVLGHQSQDELLGRNMHEIMHHTRKDGTPYPLHECKVVGTIEHGTGEHVADEVFWRADGTSIPVEYWSYPQMQDGRIVGAVVTFMDISDRMRREDQLRQVQKMEAVGTLAGGIAHDFNNIMMAIMGYAHLLKMSPSVKEQDATAVDEIITASERAAYLTQGLLAFSRKQIMRRAILDLNEVTRTFRSMISRLLREDIELHLQLSPGSILVDGDRGQVEQVIMNLVTNARDSMLKGGRILITTGVTEISPDETDRYQVPAPGAYGCVTVSDTGQGMDEDTLSHIFEPFFTTKEVGKGTGLGLSMVYGIMKKHNGSVIVSSEPGQGTAVSLYLPVVAAKPAAPSAPKGKGRLAGSELVLVVEDNEAARTVVRDILARYGYAILEATDGKHAAELFREKGKEIRLVISDMVMPNKSGWELFRELKEVRPDVKFLFLSGYDRSMALDQEAGSEEIHFLQKPLKPQELLAKVREMLDAPA